MTCFAPRQIEYMGSNDLPHEPQLVLFINAYKYIPVFRGNVRPSSMKAGVSVLKQGGVIGIFPEGGIWEPAIRKAQSGVAWMSYHGKAPVLPIGFTPTAGAVGKALKFQRPTLKVKIGKLIPPVEVKPGKPKKDQFQEAAQLIMDKVWELVPEKEREPYGRIEYEHFSMDVSLYTHAANPVEIPDKLNLKNGHSLSKVLYRTTLINNFRANLGFDIDPLKNLNRKVDPDDLVRSIQQILTYLEDDNPYYFTYRYGLEEGKSMEQGFREFQKLAQWASDQGYTIDARPIRKYKLEGDEKEIVETYPTELAKW
jgi:1-acyl-sn-glycerol-3-phosphate acyltransferase